MKEMLRKEDTALSQRLGNLTCVVMTATLRELGNGSHLPSFRSSIFKPYESFLATFHSLFSKFYLISYYHHSNPHPMASLGHYQIS